MIRQWDELKAGQIAVVCSKDLPAIQDELDQLGFSKENRIYNPAPDRGMFSSIQCAAAWPGWNTNLTHWVIALGDQPHLRQGTLQTLLDSGAANPNRICQPLRGGRRRHPVLLPKAAFAGLKDCAVADLKQFLEYHENEWAGYESDDAGLDFDMDTPADYEHARQLYSNRD